MLHHGLYGVWIKPLGLSHPLRGGAKRSGDARCNVVLQIGHKVLHVMAIHCGPSTTHAMTQLINLKPECNRFN